jgi:hypothetical protein
MDPDKKDTSEDDGSTKTDDGGSDAKDESLGEAGLKALQAERDARKTLEAELKELRPLAVKAKELEDAKKSNEQRNADEIAALKADLQSERLGRARAQVGAAKGLPASLIPLLKGETAEEMETHADELLADLKDKYVPKTTATSDDTGGGVKGKPSKETMEDDDKVAARIFANG